MHVRYSPLPQQFADVDEVFDELRALVASGDFTLGKVVDEFEHIFAKAAGTKYAIGVGSGTDSLKLALKAIGIGPGNEVLTNANTFFATAGAINEVGATPTFVDCDDTFCMDVNLLEDAITPRTKALMPVHLAGNVSNMPRIMEIANKHSLPVVEDGCQSLLGELNGTKVGSWGIATGFSMHPLKIINVWGDAGIVVTNDAEMDRKLRLLRNHGLRNRDEMEIFGYNSRLDSFQAVVGKWMLQQIHDLVDKRIEAAKYYDEGFRDMPGVRIPPIADGVKHVYLLYILFAENRDALLEHCLKNDIEAKIHYPIPLYQQEALKPLGIPPGTFPVTDGHSRDCITIPVDQHLSREEQDFVIDTVRDFYKGPGA